MQDEILTNTSESEGKKESDVSLRYGYVAGFPTLLPSADTALGALHFHLIPNDYSQFL